MKEVLQAALNCVNSEPFFLTLKQEVGRLEEKIVEYLRSPDAPHLKRVSKVRVTHSLSSVHFLHTLAYIMASGN